MRTTALGVLLLATLVALTGPAAMAGAAANVDDGSQTGAVTDEHADGVATGIQETNETDGANGSEATACDYERLYEETIDSIVQVQLEPTGDTQQGGGIGSGFVYATADEFDGANGSTDGETDGANDTAADADAANDTEADGGDAAETNDSAADADADANDTADAGNETADDDATSYVVTNHHVVQDRDTVTVEFREGDSREGEVVGSDLYSDLAVVAVSDTPDYVESLPVAAEAPSPGEPVAALGSPFGLEGTITEGIVSAVDRAIPAQQTQQGQQMQTGFTIPNTVQTDAPINPGNSGGPLVDCEGSVVGVNSAGMGQNLGFAVGTSLLERVVPELVENGEYAHSFLGVQTYDVTAQLAEANDLESTDGVYVHAVAPEGPAAEALEGTSDTEAVDETQAPVGGDVIVAIDGEEIRNGEELSSYLALETSPGDEVELTVLRNGEETTVTVTLAERPQPESTGP